MEKNKKGNKGGNKNDKKDSKGGKGDKSDKGGDKSDKLKTCNFVKARHILSSKLSVIEEIYNKLTETSGNSPSPSEFGKLAEEHSECPSKKKGGNLGYFTRASMVGAFAEAAFSTAPGQMSGIIKTTHGYHIILVEDRKMENK
jgi:NIMA-interacting peptidyl-prolyl cis-trans isomerase 4